MRPRTKPTNKLRLKHKMILNPSLKDHIINIADSSLENHVASKKHKKVVKEDKIQEPKPIGKYPEEFQEPNNEIISKRMKLKPRRPVKVPIDIGFHPGSMSYVLSQELPVLEQAYINIESTVKNKGRQVLDLPYSNTESSKSETTPTVSTQQLIKKPMFSIPVTKLDILTKEALKDLDM
jgi:hypothetical protein